MTLDAAMRKANRREEWRELVARSSVAPERNGQLDYGMVEGGAAICRIISKLNR